MTENDLDTDELIFNLITIKKYKKYVQLWLNHLNELVECKKEIKEIDPSTQLVIKYYLSELKYFSESLMKVLIKLQYLTRNIKQFETDC